MLGRYVGRRIVRKGIGSIFADSAAELSKADIAFGNLECVLSKRPFVVSKRILLRADPSSAAGLARAGFDVLSVANNHSLDAGSAGLDDTLGVLGKVGILGVGAGSVPIGGEPGIAPGVSYPPYPPVAEAQEGFRWAGPPPPLFPFRKGEPSPDGSGLLTSAPLGFPEGPIVERGGVRIAFLAYCDFPGASGIAYTDEGRLPEDIASARKVADVVIVSWHWGNELSTTVSKRQRHLARLAARAGADVILGHHPHVLQAIEWLPGRERRCLVAYSLGNFVFDAGTAAEKQTGILHVALSKEGARSYSFSKYTIYRGSPRLKPSRSSDHPSNESRLLPGGSTGY